MLEILSSLTDSPKVLNKDNLSSLDSLLASAINTIQKSQCISKYIKYQSPNLISTKCSPSFIKPLDSRLKERDPLPLIEHFRASQSPVKNKSPPKAHFSRTLPPKADKNGVELEVTGTSKVYTQIESRLSKIQENLHQRKMSISILEDERKERYYSNYKAKLRQIAHLRDLKSKNRVKSISKARCCSDRSNYPDKNVETFEVSLQTPANFNN